MPTVEAHFVFYIALEGHIQRVHRLDFASDLQKGANVFDLTPHLNTIDELAKVSAFDLDILYYNRERIPSETTLKVLEKRTSRPLLQCSLQLLLQQTCSTTRSDTCSNKP